MKKLIDLSSEEIQHRCEWFEFYKMLANILFVALVFYAFYFSLIGGEPERLKYQIKCERTEFESKIKENNFKFWEFARNQSIKADSIKWMREAKIGIEKENE